MITDSSQADQKAQELHALEHRRREKLAGYVVLGVSVAAFVSSLLMDRIGTGIDRFLGAPGLTPGFLSVVLIALSLMLILRNRDVSLPALPRGLSQAQWRMMGVFGLIFGYILSLYWLPYLVSTFLMMMIFQFGFASRKRSPGYILIWCVGYSAAISGALYYVFGEIFFIPLP